MENEIWKFVEGYEKYQISSYGRVKSYYNNKESILNPIIDAGYYYICLYQNKIPKKLSVHRLVGKAFIPNPENKPEINHKDANKSNNHLSNLEWVTPKQNTQHAWQTGLCENVRKNAIKAHEASKKPVFSSKLDIKFKSLTEAATYLKIHYFENITLNSLKTGIRLLMTNKITKSKYDFGWEICSTNK